jgi:hypothetical protein
MKPDKYNYRVWPGSVTKKEHNIDRSLHAQGSVVEHQKRAVAGLTTDPATAPLLTPGIILRPEKRHHPAGHRGAGKQSGNADHQHADKA